MFVTNNGTKSRKQYAQKLQGVGITAQESDIMCSSYVAANYLSNIPFKGSAYVVGEGGLFEELATVGINAYGKVS